MTNSVLPLLPLCFSLLLPSYLNNFSRYPTLISTENKHSESNNMSSGRNVLVAVLRNDLRLHDHPIFSLCNLDGSSTSATSNKFKKPVTHLLPIYVLDEKFVETGGLPEIQKKKEVEARTRVAGFWRTGEHRVR